MKTTSKQRSGLSAMVMKAMGLFTGLQMFNILCSLVKMKLVSIWLHATGVGLFGIYNNTVDTIASLTDLGLRQSATRDVAQAASNPTRLARTAAVVRRWSGIAGLLGALVISGASPLISQWFFADWSHWWEFMLLSAAMLLNSLINGEQAILQGSNRLKQLARSSFIGTLVGLLLSIPLFRYAGDPGIVVSIVLYSVCILASTLCVRYRKPQDVEKPRISIREGKSFVQLGAYIAIATFVSNMAQVVFLAFLNRTASIETVGYYQAGYMVVIRYAGLLFTAIAIEYYPRLSANIASKRRIETFVSHEIILLSLMLIPFLLVFFMLRNVVVDILYTSDFLVIVPFMSWAAVGIPLRGASQCLGYTIVAKGDGKIYALIECADAVIGLTLNILLFNRFGLIGLGYAYILWYAIYTVMVSLAYFMRYHMRLSRQAIGLAALNVALCVASIVSLDRLPWPVSILWMSATAILFTLLFARFLRK